MSKYKNDDRPVAAFITLGCKANRYDSSAMMAMVGEGRFQVVEETREGRGPVKAEVYIINTCAVTHKSAFQSRQMIRRVKKWNPESKIIATGCLGKVETNLLKKAGADLVTGPLERDKVINFLGGVLPQNQLVFHHPNGGVQGRSRAVVKIQDGCDFNCSYCIVNKVRGESQSLSITEVISQLEAISKKGFNEAVLTGIHIGLFGKDRGQRLHDLIRAVNEAKNIPERIRLSSIDPHELTEELVEIISKSGRICPHLHIPLQSGDQDVLKRMRRPYSPKEAADHIMEAYEKIPDLAIGLDVIAGFPGETETAHKNTADLISSLPVTYLHVFPFSKRPGTDAAEMKDQLDPKVIKGRAKELRELGDQKKKGFLEKQKGRTLEVLAETEEDGTISGTSGNYISVSFEGRPDQINKICFVKTNKVSGNMLSGQLADNIK